MSNNAHRSAPVAFGLMLLSALVACQAHTGAELTVEPPQASSGSSQRVSVSGNFTRPHAETGNDGRKRRVTAQGFTNLSAIVKPGYYNLLLFSTEHCDPCKYLWDQADGWLRQYANLAVTDVDVTRVFEEGDQSRAPELALLRDFGLGRIPSAVLVSPLGYVVIARDGANEIAAMVHRALHDRPYRDVILFDGQSASASSVPLAGATVGVPQDGRVLSADAVATILRNLGVTDLVRTERVDSPGPVLLQGQTAVGDKVTVTLMPNSAPLVGGLIEDLARSGAVARTDAFVVAVVIERDPDQKRARKLLANLMTAIRHTIKHQ